MIFSAVGYSIHAIVAAIITLVWKSPTLPFVKVNKVGSAVDGLAACGGIFLEYDQLGSKIGFWVVELFGFVLALEFSIKYH